MLTLPPTPSPFLILFPSLTRALPLRQTVKADKLDDFTIRKNILASFLPPVDEEDAAVQ